MKISFITFRGPEGVTGTCIGKATPFIKRLCVLQVEMDRQIKAASTAWNASVPPQGLTIDLRALRLARQEHEMLRMLFTLELRATFPNKAPPDGASFYIDTEDNVFYFIAPAPAEEVKKEPVALVPVEDARDRPLPLQSGATMGDRFLERVTAASRGNPGSKLN